MLKPLSRRLTSIKPSGIRELFEIASKYPDVANLTLGEPDADTPEYIKRAACKALDVGFTHYTTNLGILELRKAMARKYEREYGVDVSPESEILVTQGGTQAILVGLTALLEEGDEVLIPTPAFVGYAGVATLLGARIVEVETVMEDGFTPTREALEKSMTDRTKVIVVNSPSNPTGSMYERHILEEVADFALEHDLYILSDEVYEKFVFDGEMVSMLSLGEDVKRHTLLVNSLSKTYAMTGWRIGYLIAPEEVISTAVRYQMYDGVCPSSIAQKAALAALEGPQDFVKSYTSEIKGRVEYAHRMLSSMSHVNVVKPRGAFYIFPRIDIGMSSVELCKKVIEEERVAMVPGSAFGKGGEDHVRISLAASMEIIERGLNGLQHFLTKTKR